MMNSGIVLNAHTATSQSQPRVCARRISAGLRPRFFHTMSLGFGASVTVEPFGFLCRSMFATMCAYGTAAMDAKP